MMVCGLAALVILALAGALGFQRLEAERRRPPVPTPEQRRAGALRILEERYARSEISRDEFEERRRTLRGS